MVYFIKHDGEDRFSDLPDTIIHHIYSFFDRNEISCIFRVSTRLRDLCFSCSSMFLQLYITSSNNRKLFHNFLSKLVSNSKPNTPLLSLNLSCDKDKKHTLHNNESVFPKDLCIPHLESLSIKYHELELLESRRMGDSFNQKSSPSLTTLVLHFDSCVFDNDLIIDIKSPSLRKLEISCVECYNSTYMDYEFAIRIMTPSVEHLTLKNFKFVIKDVECRIIIWTDELRSLVIDNIELLEIRPRDVPKAREHSIMIHAPKLRSLHWKGSPVYNFEWTNTRSILPKELPYWVLSGTWVKYDDESDVVQGFPLLEDAVLEVRGTSNRFMKKILLSMQHAKHLDVRLQKFKDFCKPSNPKDLSLCPYIFL